MGMTPKKIYKKYYECNKSTPVFVIVNRDRLLEDMIF